MRGAGGAAGQTGCTPHRPGTWEGEAGPRPSKGGSRWGSVASPTSAALEKPYSRVWKRKNRRLGIFLCAVSMVSFLVVCGS